jgi:voltage-gated potassium channel
MLRKEHAATLLAVNRDGHTYSNLSSDFTLELGDDLVVVAESLGDLTPVQEEEEVEEVAGVVEVAD